jgi:hypothetical protein
VVLDRSGHLPRIPPGVNSTLDLGDLFIPVECDLNFDALLRDFQYALAVKLAIGSLNYHIINP